MQVQSLFPIAAEASLGICFFLSAFPRSPDPKSQHPLGRTQAETPVLPQRAEVLQMAAGAPHVNSWQHEAVKWLLQLIVMATSHPLHTQAEERPSVAMGQRGTLQVALCAV